MPVIASSHVSSWDLWAYAFVRYFGVVNVDKQMIFHGGSICEVGVVGLY